MTLDELKSKLAGLGPRQRFGLPMDECFRLFPPNDQKSVDAFDTFSRAVGCVIETEPDRRMVWFVKDAPPMTLGQPTRPETR
jgi:hypothetical protein